MNTETPETDKERRIAALEKRVEELEDNLRFFKGIFLFVVMVFALFLRT